MFSNTFSYLSLNSRFSVPHMVSNGTEVISQYGAYLGTFTGILLAVDIMAHPFSF